MANQSNSIYQQHQRMADPSSVVRPAAREASAQQLHQHQQDQDQDTQQHNDEGEIYASYARSPAPTSDHAHAGGQSIYGGIDSSAYSHHSHAGQRGASTPPSAQLPPLPQPTPAQQASISHMYPSSASHATNVGNYGNPSYLPRDDSVDVSESALGHGDAASIHSRSHLNPKNNNNTTQNIPRGAQPLVARFQSDQIRPAAVYADDFENKQEGYINEKTSAGISQPNSASTSNEKDRQLPEGYKTPPSFSRASSAWGGTSSKGNKNKNTGAGAGGTTGSGSSSPYGPLGGLASKSDPALQFAEGDYANTRFARFWLMILSKNIVIRWLCFIIPVLALLWIPGGQNSLFIREWTAKIQY